MERRPSDTIHCSDYIFGPEEWDGPLSLFDMMDVSDPKGPACMDNYHVHLMAPAQMSDEEIMKFQSSLRDAVETVKEWLGITDGAQ